MLLDQCNINIDVKTREKRREERQKSDKRNETKRISISDHSERIKKTHIDEENV